MDRDSNWLLHVRVQPWAVLKHEPGTVEQGKGVSIIIWLIICAEGKINLIPLMFPEVR